MRYACAELKRSDGWNRYMEVNIGGAHYTQHTKKKLLSLLPRRSSLDFCRKKLYSYAWLLCWNILGFDYVASIKGKLFYLTSLIVIVSVSLGPRLFGLRRSRGPYSRSTFCEKTDIAAPQYRFLADPKLLACDWFRGPNSWSHRGSGYCIGRRRKSEFVLIGALLKKLPREPIIALLRLAEQESETRVYTLLTQLGVTIWRPRQDLSLQLLELQIFIWLRL